MSRVMIRLLSAETKSAETLGWRASYSATVLRSSAVLPAQCPFLRQVPTFGRTARFKPVVLGIADGVAVSAQEDVVASCLRRRIRQSRDQALVLPGGSQVHPSRVRFRRREICSLTAGSLSRRWTCDLVSPRHPRAATRRSEPFTAWLRGSS